MLHKLISSGMFAEKDNLLPILKISFSHSFHSSVFGFSSFILVLMLLVIT
jgi:hypothetical protein